MFRDLRMPVLVIRGERDQVYPSAVFEEVARTIPDAEDVNIGVSRHLVPLERADAVNRAIGRFVGGQVDEPSWWSRRSTTAASLDRPWLKHYEEGVPVTLGLPKRPLFRLLHSAVRRFGNRPAVVFGGRSLTYKQLDAECNRLANALRSLGIEKGTRVMVLLPNTPQFVIAYYAILKAGGVVVSTSPVNDRHELQRQVMDSQVDWLITLTLFSETARHVLANTALRGILFTNIKDYLSPWKQMLFSFTRETKEGHHLSGGLQKNEFLWTNLTRISSPNTPAGGCEL